MPATIDDPIQTAAHGSSKSQIIKPNTTAAKALLKTIPRHPRVCLSRSRDVLRRYRLNLDFHVGRAPPAYRADRAAPLLQSN